MMMADVPTSGGRHSSLPKHIWLGDAEDVEIGKQCRKLGSRMRLANQAKSTSVSLRPSFLATLTRIGSISEEKNQGR